MPVRNTLRGRQVAAPFLLRRGNTKLGESIYHFSVPAKLTCPGRTKLCTKICYALRSRYFTSAVRLSLMRARRASRKKDFAARMIAEIRRRWIGIVRVHAAGDYDTPAYARAWLAIMRACPNTQFVWYTRSWRIPEIRKVLEVMATLPNVRGHYSLDRETGLPAYVPPTVRLAYVSVAEDDLPPAQADLVFLDYPLRKTGQKYFGGVLGCPAETVGLTCERCRLCLDKLSAKDPRHYRRTPETVTGRIPLPLAS